jgi:hypothetical protein
MEKKINKLWLDVPSNICVIDQSKILIRQARSFLPLFFGTQLNLDIKLQDSRVDLLG